MKAVITKSLLGFILCVCCSTTFAAPQSQSRDNLAVQNLVRHDIFQNMYYQPAPINKKKTSKIKETIKKIKKLVDLSFDEHLKFKVSRVKSGPLKQSVTQMVEVAPGIQTNDGLVGESSKGYGIKLTYSFD